MLATAISPRAEASGRDRAAQVVTDETGRRITLPAEVQRIVTLAPNLTETIYALGVEDRLVGDTTYCDSPPAARSKPHVGPPVNPSLEAIVALKPDLVLATTSINRRETVAALARIGIAVYATDARTVRGMLESIAHIAGVVGAAPQGATLVAQLQARLDALHAGLEDLPVVHVLFVVWDEPLITIGQKTFIADALRWAGAESVVQSKQNWPQLSLEEVVRLQPDAIVLTSNHAETGRSELGNLRGRAGWKDLRAVELGRVATVGEEITRPSPGLVSEIERLARQIHPEAFATPSAEGESKPVTRRNSFAVEKGSQESASCAR